MTAQALNTTSVNVTMFHNLVEVTELPEKHQQLLVELDLLGRVGQVGLSQGVGQQTRQALQHEVKVLQMETHNAEIWPYLQGELVGMSRRREWAHLFSVNPGQVIHKQVFRACGLHTHKEGAVKHVEYSHRVLSLAVSVHTSCSSMLDGEAGR